MLGTVPDVDDAQLEDLLAKSDRIVVVEYYTPTCPVCRGMAPLLDAAAEQLQGQAAFVKVNAQAHQAHAAAIGIRGVPTFVFYCAGKPLGMLVGAVPPVVLKNTIEDLAKHKSECGAATKISFDIDPYA